jgi:thioredoxin 1
MLIEVSDQSFDSEVIKSVKPVMVDLWAPWCGPCRMVAPVIEKLDGDYDGKVKFCKLNVDKNPKTLAKYGVMSIPTLLLFKNGQVEDTIVGAVPESVLKQRIDKML